MRTRVIICLIFAFLSFSVVSGQKAGKKMTITGYVVDGTRASVANAAVMVDGKGTERYTDHKGFYKVRVNASASTIGIMTMPDGYTEQAINGRTRINFDLPGTVAVQLPSRPNPGDEVIDIGYGSVKKRDVTTSVGKIDGTNPKYASYQSIYDMIRGELPGVQVTGNSIRIQGVSSLTLSTEPLFVVDGVTVNSISEINPSMVRSIQVLKGASASIYGSRGANGVILINLIKAGDK